MKILILLELIGIHVTDFIYANNDYTPIKIIKDFIGNKKNEIKSISKILFDILAKEFDE